MKDADDRVGGSGERSHLVLFLDRLPRAGTHHPRVKQWLRVKNNKGPNPEGLISIEGMWAIGVALAANIEFRAFFLSPDLLRSDQAREVASAVVGTGVHSYVVSERVLQRLVDRDKPDGLAAIGILKKWEWNDLMGNDVLRIAVLDGLEIPGNVGSIIRTVDATRASGVVLTNRRVRLSHPKVLRASMGGLFTVPILTDSVENAVQELKARDISIIVTDSSASTDFRAIEYGTKVAVVLGSERYGVNQLWRDAAEASVRIPILGRVNSLNVGHVGVLMLYEVLFRQQGFEDATKSDLQLDHLEQGSK